MITSIKDIGIPELNALLNSIKVSETTTRKDKLGIKTRYPKRIDSINYTGSVFMFLIRGGNEPCAPEYFTYEEEHNLFMKAVTAAKAARFKKEA